MNATISRRSSFELVARRAKARYVTGLSASITRKDGHHPIIFMQCGPVRYRVDARQQAAARPFTHHVLVRPTGFRAPDLPAADSRVEFQRLYEALTQDSGRNQLICEDVIAAVASRPFPTGADRTHRTSCGFWRRSCRRRFRT